MASNGNDWTLLVVVTVVAALFTLGLCGALLLCSCTTATSSGTKSLRWFPPALPRHISFEREDVNHGSVSSWHGGDDEKRMPPHPPETTASCLFSRGATAERDNSLASSAEDLNNYTFSTTTSGSSSPKEDDDSVCDNESVQISISMESIDEFEASICSTPSQQQLPWCDREAGRTLFQVYFVGRFVTIHSLLL